MCNKTNCRGGTAWQPHRSDYAYVIKAVILSNAIRMYVESDMMAVSQTLRDARYRLLCPPKL